MSKLSKIFIRFIVSSLILAIGGSTMLACNNHTPRVNDYVKPLERGVVTDESVLFLDEGGVATAKLLFAPTRIISVKQYFTLSGANGKNFTEGTDYTLSGDALTAVGLAIPRIDKDIIYGKEQNFSGWSGVDFSQIPTQDGNYLPFTESFYIMARHVFVTYNYDAKDCDAPKTQVTTKLTRTLDKLKNKDKLDMFVFGDSIATGANASGVLGVAPNRPDFVEETANNLSSYFGGKINVTNKSVGGFTTNNGIYGGNGWVGGVQVSQKGIDGVLKDLGANYKPDLALIHFGLNDGSLGLGGYNPDIASHGPYIAAAFKENIETIIASIRARSPHAEILLIVSQKSNPLAVNQCKAVHDLLPPKLHEIAAENKYIDIIDFGAYHQYLLDNKDSYLSMSNNGVNHPGDFITARYASQILSKFINLY